MVLMKCRLKEVEELIEKLDTSDVNEDLIEIDANRMIWLKGFEIVIAEISINIRKGVICIWDEEAQIYLPDEPITILYHGSLEENKPINYCEADVITTLEEWFKDGKAVNKIEQFMCEIKILDKERN